MDSRLHSRCGFLNVFGGLRGWRMSLIEYPTAKLEEERLEHLPSFSFGGTMAYLHENQGCRAPKSICRLTGPTGKVINPFPSTRHSCTSFQRFY